MALKGLKKADWQREYMRDYMRKKRAGLNKASDRGLNPPTVGLNILSVRPKELGGTPKPPLYNPSVHRPGDRVMVYRGKRLTEVVIPELDGSGQPIPEWV